MKAMDKENAVEFGCRTLCKELGLAHSIAFAFSFLKAIYVIPDWPLFRVGAGYTKKDKPCDLGQGFWDTRYQSIWNNLGQSISPR